MIYREWTINTQHCTLLPLLKAKILCFTSQIHSIFLFGLKGYFGLLKDIKISCFFSFYLSIVNQQYSVVKHSEILREPNFP